MKICSQLLETSFVHFVGSEEEATEERNNELRHRHCTMGIEIVDAAKVGITCMNEASVLFKHLRKRESIV
jgi:hypothetical protein